MRLLYKVPLSRHRLASLFLACLAITCVTFYSMLSRTGIIPDFVSDPAILEAFLKDYQTVCERHTSQNKLKDGQLPLCPCLPPKPVGLYNVKAWYQKLTDTDAFTESMAPVALANALVAPMAAPAPLPSAAPVTVGGSWRPTSCHARQRVAIIIPFRNRHEHLHVFTRYMHSFLQRQLLDYTIFVIEQASPDIFNRAAVMNAGFLEVNKFVPEGFDCYIFHDVDLLPEDDRNMYTCFYAPIHLGAYMNKFLYKMPYPEFFGGAVSLDRNQILSINGFPNKFFGWGGEDDAVYSRVLLQNLTINRYPQMVGRSYMFKHELDDDNPVNPLRSGDLIKEAEEYTRVGLSTVKYQRHKVTQADQYTMITVSIEPEYNPACIVDQSIAPSIKQNYVNCMTKDNFNTGKLECCREGNSVSCCNLTGGNRLLLPSIAGVTLTVVILLGVAVRRRKPSLVPPSILR